MNRFLKFGIVILIIGVMVFFGILSVNFYVKHVTRDQIIDEGVCRGLKDVDCIIVLGASVWGDSPSPMLEDRLKKAISLYHDGVSSKIIMTGDHGKEYYDEVTTMKNYAIKMGVPSKDIFMDHAGFSSYDSMYRAKEIFGVKKAVVVTQKYHLYRSVYIANKLGIVSYGVPAEHKNYMGNINREVREMLARFKDGIKCIFKPEPEFLGEKIPLNQDGNIT